jgi:hypothetical protein
MRWGSAAAAAAVAGLVCCELRAAGSPDTNKCHHSFQTTVQHPAAVTESVTLCVPCGAVVT